MLTKKQDQKRRGKREGVYFLNLREKNNGTRKIKLFSSSFFKLLPPKFISLEVIYLHNSMNENLIEEIRLILGYLKNVWNEWICWRIIWVFNPDKTNLLSYRTGKNGQGVEYFNYLLKAYCWGILVPRQVKPISTSPRACFILNPGCKRTGCRDSVNLSKP